MFDDYQPEALWSRLVRLTATPQMRRRYRFIEFALADYAEGRYYSTIPLLLMIIDGSVNDLLGKGFHTENACMDVWDAITGIDGGIENIKGIFKKGRLLKRAESAYRRLYIGVAPINFYLLESPTRNISD